MDIDEDSIQTEPSEPLHGHFTPLWQCARIEVEWIIKDQLPVGTHFLAGSPKKSRKSTMALAQALMVSGKMPETFPVHMRDVQATGRVIIYSHEAEGGILRQAAEDGLNVHGDPEDESIIVADDPWLSKLDSQKGRKYMMDWWRELCPKLVIIDPLNRQHSSDENSASEMTSMLGPLGQLAHELHFCLLIIHHINKPQPKDGKAEGQILRPYDMRGSGALYGLADGVTMVTPRRDGFKHFESEFKRAADVSRCVRLGIWGETAREWLSDLDKAIWQEVKDNGADLQSLTEKFDKTEEEILECMSRLLRNRLVTGDKDRGYSA